MAFAKEVGIPFVQTSISEIFKLIGKCPKADYPIEDRLVIQEAILYALDRQYAEARRQSRVFITDRCPLDLASYMLADVQRETFRGQPRIAAMVNDYVARCIASTNNWFSTVVLVQPGIPLVEAPGKALACTAYIEHLLLIQRGLLTDDRLGSHHYLIPKRFTSMQDRLEALTNAAAHAVEANESIRTKREDAGILLH